MKILFGVNLLQNGILILHSNWFIDMIIGGFELLDKIDDLFIGIRKFPICFHLVIKLLELYSIISEKYFIFTI